MKILSLYLPGYHKEPINDKAWGEGFTEWDNVKKGKKLYKGHNQPIVPYNNYYYDLSKKEDIEKQIEIAKEYKVDGFIFYHYWFGNNKQALEKPVQILKDKIETSIEYCFCWANHSWITNWHGQNSEIIVKQEYGKEEEWKKHIKYLIEFFKDERYIKIDGRPLLYIYNMSEIPNIKDMLDLWNKELIKQNMKEIYIVEFISSKNRKLSYNKSDAVVEFEPLYTTYFDISKPRLFVRFLKKKFNKIDFQNYDYLWKKIINRKRKYNGKIIQKGCFVGWDNSARKGYDCMIVKNSSPEKFGKYLKMLLENNRKDATNDFIIINAWNEWSEGAMLEPTVTDEYNYLQQIKKIKGEKIK